MNRSSILRGTLLAGSFLTCFPGRDNAVGGDEPESAHPYNPPVAAASAEPQQALKSVRVPQGLRLELYRRRAAGGQPRRLRLRRARTAVRGRDLPPAQGRHRQPPAHELARRRPRQPHRRRPRRHVPQVSGQGVRGATARSTTGSGSSRTATATARPTRATVFADGFHDAAVGLGSGVLARTGRRLLHLHPRPLAAPRQRRRRQGRHPHVAPPRLRRPRRLPRPRPARAPVRPRRQALLQHRRPRPERHHDRRPHALLPRHRRRAPVRARRHRTWRSSPPASAIPQELAFDEHGNLFTVRQQLRQRRQGPAGLRRRGGRQRLADRLPVPQAAGQPRPLERREALAPRLGRPGRLHPAAAGQHLRRPLGPDLRPRRRPASPSAIAGHFFLADFRGTASQSGVRSFAVKPRGASFEIDRLRAVPLGPRGHRRRLRPRRRALRLRLGRGLADDHARGGSSRSSTPSGQATRRSARSSA